MIKNLNSKKLFKGIGVVLLHFLLLILLQIPFIYLTKNDYIIYLVPYTITLLVFILLFRKDLINDFKDLKKNLKKIIKESIKYWLIGFAIMYISGMIIAMLPIDNVINQEQNTSLLKIYPIIEILIACIIAPITEEIVFRLSFKKFTDNKWLFAFVTGLLFAAIHVLSSLRNPIMLIYLIPYGALGVTFGLAYYKTDNIYGTMFVHALHNTISILELLIIGGIIL